MSYFVEKKADNEHYYIACNWSCQKLYTFLFEKHSIDKGIMTYNLLFDNKLLEKDDEIEE